LPLELAFIESISTQGSGPVPAPTPITNNSGSKPIKNESPPTLPADPQVKASPKVKSLRADNDKWDQLLVIVKKESPITNGLLNSCRTRDYQNGVLTLGYSSDVLRDRMVEDCHSSVVKKAAEEVFGSVVKVECVVNAGGRTQLPPEMDSTGMIATGLRLGGEIVDINQLSKEAD
jgi:hypothetical protein